MSKQLILVRHGNARSATYGVEDFDRTLDNKGVNEAQEVAFRLKNRHILPELLVSSSAIRAISTARIFAGIWDIKPEHILMKDAIYESSITTLLRIVNNLPEDTDSAALFGHNPEMSAFMEYLADTGIVALPTCGVVVISFDVEHWNMISKDLGTMLLFDYPGAGNAS